MSRILGIASVFAVVLVAMGFAAANAGHWTTLELGIITLYRVPVTLVAFSGLLTGMLVMFAVGISSDLKVRRILRERLAEEAQKEQRWIDRHQQDLFATGQDEGKEEGSSEPSPRPLQSPRDVPLVQAPDDNGEERTMVSGEDPPQKPDLGLSRPLGPEEDRPKE